MSINTQSLTVPPNTSESNPARLAFSLGSRFITRIGIQFPAGCYGAVGVRILDTNHILAPTTGGWIRGDNQFIEWPENLKVNGPPWRVTLEGISIADDWPHTIGFYLVTQ